MALTVQQIADFAATRLSSVNARFMSKRDKEYANAEHVDFEIDDALIRVHMNNHVKSEFKILKADINKSRQELMDKYAETALSNFKRDFLAFSKAYVVSVPIQEMKDPGRLYARSNIGGLNVSASAIADKDGNFDVTIEILFGVLSL